MNYSKDFLKKLDYAHNKKLFIKIIALDNDDLPTEEISGQCTGGSINVDGASAVRRSCSLTLTASKEDNISKSAWAYNNKFKLQVGLKNEIDSTYPDVIWFNQGIYIISSFNITENPNNFTISIQGKDKMCRLNGEISGLLPVMHDFGKEENVNKEGEVTPLTYIPIPTIITEAVHEYAREPMQNILVRDLDDFGYELMEYRGEKPMYLFVGKTQGHANILNMTFDDNVQITLADGREMSLSKLPKYYSFNTLDSKYNDNATQIKYSGDILCYVAKIETGDTAGYHQIDLIYDKDLILNAGDNVCSLLDKLVAFLGNFEYFYDVNGKFIFQKKKDYIQELFSPINGEIIEPTVLATPYSYRFDDKELITNLGDTPAILETKNDFSIVGQLDAANGSSYFIHVRYALDKKPTSYVSYDSKTYDTSSYDWRELIYQMADDYQKHREKPNFLMTVAKNNPWAVDGKTRYEQYYTDILSFWRGLYNPNPKDKEKDLYFDANGYNNTKDGAYWAKQVYTNPQSLVFWFDFLDTESDLGQYSANKIGTRSKVVNESAIKSIYYKETPEIQFAILPDDKITGKEEYTTFQIQSNMSNLFYRSAQGVSAISQINSLISSYTATAEGISFSCIPIYYLEPNTRIYLDGIGDCTVNQISYNLNYDGTMSISGNKILKTIY